MSRLHHWYDQANSVTTLNDNGYISQSACDWAVC